MNSAELNPQVNILLGSDLPNKDLLNEKVKLLNACEGCVGYIKDCDNCGQKIEILNGKPLNYHEGSIHRCGRQRY